MQEMQVQSLGWEDLLEKQIATHSSIFAWEIPWTEEPGWLQSCGPQRVRHNLSNKKKRKIHHELILTWFHLQSLFLNKVTFTGTGGQNPNISCQRVYSPTHSSRDALLKNITGINLINFFLNFAFIFMRHIVHSFVFFFP